MNIKAEWNKIVVNALSVLVATIIVGAGAIVWDRAASVDTKVQATETSLKKLVETLSEKLASYEVQMTTMSNQLSVLINNQSKLITHVQDNRPIAGTPFINPKSTIPDPDRIQLQQKAASADMIQQFKR
jgi:predicted PurR-regulated permease PerM